MTDTPERLATINWKGTRIRGKAYMINNDGSWVMIALEKHPRFEEGHFFLAQPNEITWDDES